MFRSRAPESSSDVHKSLLGTDKLQCIRVSDCSGQQECLRHARSTILGPGYTEKLQASYLPAICVHQFLYQCIQPSRSYHLAPSEKLQLSCPQLLSLCDRLPLQLRLPVPLPVVHVLSGHLQDSWQNLMMTFPFPAITTEVV